MSTRSTLENIDSHLNESIGVRRQGSSATLTPLPSEKDIRRRAIRDYGTIDIDQVVPDPNQPRENFSDEELDQLAQSILKQGQLSPIRVRWSEELGKWGIVFGQRRWEATKRAGLREITCHFYEGELSETETLVAQLAENLLRSDLNPVEEARAFRRLMDLNGWSGKQLGAELSVAPAKVSRSLALLELPDDVVQFVEEKQLSARSAYEISKLKDDDKRRTIAGRAVSRSLSHDQTAKLVRQTKGKAKALPKGTHLTFVTESGWSVTVTAKRKGVYAEVEDALQYALQEVQLRRNNNVQLF